MLHGTGSNPNSPLIWNFQHAPSLDGEASAVRIYRQFTVSHGSSPEIPHSLDNPTTLEYEWRDEMSFWLFVVLMAGVADGKAMHWEDIAQIAFTEFWLRPCVEDLEKRGFGLGFKFTVSGNETVCLKETPAATRCGSDGTLSGSGSPDRGLASIQNSQRVGNSSTAAPTHPRSLINTHSPTPDKAVLPAKYQGGVSTDMHELQKVVEEPKRAAANCSFTNEQVIWLKENGPAGKYANREDSWKERSIAFNEVSHEKCSGTYLFRMWVELGFALQRRLPRVPRQTIRPPTDTSPLVTVGQNEMPGPRDPFDSMFRFNLEHDRFLTLAIPWLNKKKKNSYKTSWSDVRLRFKRSFRTDIDKDTLKGRWRFSVALKKGYNTPTPAE